MAGPLYKTSGVIDKPRRFARSSAGRLLQGEQNGPTVSLLRARGPRTLDLVLGRVGLVSSAGPYQGAAVQNAQRLLNGALGKTGLQGDLAMAHPHPLLPSTDRATPKKQIDDKSRGAVVMADEVPQEHIHDVCIQTDGAHGPLW